MVSIEKRFATYMKFLFLLGPAATILAWLVILYCISLNSWFDFARNAFSDLGTSRATHPEIYNVGLIVTGIMLMLYSVGLGLFSENKPEQWSSAFLFISGVFLALIGLYHGGTRPHTFVSTWFFIQTDMALFLWGLGLTSTNTHWKAGILYIMLANIVDNPRHPSTLA